MTVHSRQLMATVPLLTVRWKLSTDNLLRFLVRRVLPATVTELLELEAPRGRLLVLRRRVIPFLALSALQRHNFPHLDFPSVSRETVKKRNSEFRSSY